MDRRKFLNSVFSVTTLAATQGSGTMLDSKLRIAIIGAGSWGQEVLKIVMRDLRTGEIAICDTDENRRNELCIIEKEANWKFEVFSDHLQMMCSFRPHVTVVATPDHLRASHTIDAISHGSHVFTGEAVGLTLEELRKVEYVARLKKRKVHAALILRNDPGCIAALDFLRKGKLGNVDNVIIQCATSGGKISKQGLTDFSNNWRWDSGKSNGILGSEGIHWLDLVSLWRDGEFPHSVFCSGKSVCSTPSRWNSPRLMNAGHQIALYHFNNLKVRWEHRYIPSSQPYSVSCGISFHGQFGSLSHLHGEQWSVKNKNQKTLFKLSPAEQNIVISKCPLELTWTNFILSIRGESKQSADICEANRSAMLILHAKDSFTTGRTVWPTRI